jgi:hypothetical protein
MAMTNFLDDERARQVLERAYQLIDSVDATIARPPTMAEEIDAWSAAMPTDPREINSWLARMPSVNIEREPERPPTVERKSAPEIIYKSAPPQLTEAQIVAIVDKRINSVLGDFADMLGEEVRAAVERQLAEIESKRKVLPMARRVDVAVG